MGCAQLWCGLRVVSALTSDSTGSRKSPSSRHLVNPSQYGEVVAQWPNRQWSQLGLFLRSTNTLFQEPRSCSGTTGLAESLFAGEIDVTSSVIHIPSKKAFVFDDFSTSFEVGWNFGGSLTKKLILDTMFLG